MNSVTLLQSRLYIYIDRHRLIYNHVISQLSYVQIYISHIKR